MYLHIRSIYHDYKIELIFLESIDRYKYYKFFLIPELEHIMKKYNLTTDLDFKILSNNVSISTDHLADKNKGLLCIKTDLNSLSNNYEWGTVQILFILMDVFRSLVDSGSIEHMLEDVDIDTSETLHLRSSILSSHQLKNQINILINKLKTAKTYVAAKEDSSILNILYER